MAEEDETYSNEFKVYDLEGRFTGGIVGAGELEAQAEGIMLKACGNGDGWWITTAQGRDRSTFHLFDRRDLEHVGAVTGALAYTGVNLLLARRGGRHRKRSGGQQPSEQQQAGSGLAIAVGSLLDGVPESVVIGGSVLAGGPVSTAAVAAIMISNVPEGLSSATGMPGPRPWAGGARWRCSGRRR